MSNKILTREESDFFSPPLTAGPLRNELFPVRYPGFARDIFSYTGPCVCAVLAASNEEMRRLLEQAETFTKSPQFLRQTILSGFKRGHSIQALAQSTGLSEDEVELILDQPKL